MIPPEMPKDAHLQTTFVLAMAKSGTLREWVESQPAEYIVDLETILVRVSKLMQEMGTLDALDKEIELGAQEFPLAQTLLMKYRK